MGRAGVTRTFRDVLHAAAGALQAAGIDDVKREARLLAQHVFQVSAAELITRENDVVPNRDALELFETCIQRRIAREPLQHIQGTVGFYGLELLCDARALIPRPDSEVVVDAALKQLPENYDGVVADLGTGSGCLLLALLSQRLHARGIGVDASLAASELANENVAKLGLSQRAKILNSSWEDWKAWHDCDLIISNPPYICSRVIDTLESEVRDHDPMPALDGGEDGLEAYRSIFACSAKMKPDSIFVLEIGFDQSESVPKIAGESGFELIDHERDLSGHVRALTFRKGWEK